MKLCGEINIDGYIFSTNYPDYWISVDERPGKRFSERIEEGYSFGCIGIDTEEDDRDNPRTVLFQFKIPVNLDESNYVRYEKQYEIEDLTYYLLKDESIEIDLSHFVGNNKIKLVHPLRFEFSTLNGSFITCNIPKFIIRICSLIYNIRIIFHINKTTL